jgi:hypothetical protein
MRTSFALVVILLFAACASAKDDEGSKLRPVPARDVVSGGASIRGGGIRMDVQVGRAFAQKPTRSRSVKAKSGAVVAP